MFLLKIIQLKKWPLWEIICIVFYIPSLFIWLKWQILAYFCNHFFSVKKVSKHRTKHHNTGIFISNWKKCNKTICFSIIMNNPAKKCTSCTFKFTTENENDTVWGLSNKFDIIYYFKQYNDLHWVTG